MIDRVSIEPTRRCSKGCSFCYNGSSAEEGGAWSAADVIDFARDCAKNGVRAISIGGGEPLEWEGIWETLAALEGVMFRSFTTNGLLLHEHMEHVARVRPDKVHVSIHAPENAREVERVIVQVTALAAAGVRSGVNLLVRASRLEAARAASERLKRAGIGDDRIVHLPMRGHDTPTAAEVARVAGARFQSMSCLRGCAKSARFASIGADRTAAWCSYTRARRPLGALTFAALCEALDGLGLTSCDGKLVRLRVREPAP